MSKLTDLIYRETGMDMTPLGLKEGILKALKVIYYYVISGLVVGVGVVLASYHPTEGQYFAIIAMAIANSVIAGGQKWVNTHKPIEK